MNWFKRYGIAGSYFLALSFFQLKVFCPSILPMEEKSVLAIVGGLALLPIGYLVSILALWLLYNLPFQSMHIHLRIVNFLRSEDLGNLTLPDEASSELQAETWLALRARDTVEKDIRDARTDVTEWARKRWDVLGINSSILLSSYLFIFQSMVNVGLYAYHNLRFNVPLLGLCTAFVAFILFRGAYQPLLNEKSTDSSISRLLSKVF